jgi:hypothetical protein
VGRGGRFRSAKGRQSRRLNIIRRLGGSWDCTSDRRKTLSRGRSARFLHRPRAQTFASTGSYGLSPNSKTPTTARYPRIPTNSTSLKPRTYKRTVSCRVAFGRPLPLRSPSFGPGCSQWFHQDVRNAHRQRDPVESSCAAPTLPLPSPRPVSVLPASRTLAMLGWSSRTRACRSGSKLATTSFESIPAVCHNIWDFSARSLATGVVPFGTMHPKVFRRQP